MRATSARKLIDFNITDDELKSVNEKIPMKEY
jgi:hypothetical protein